MTSSQQESTAHQARNSDTLEWGIKVGLVAYGLVHLVIAWLALQVAWTPQSEKASPDGAIHTVAQQPLGAGLLVVAAIGLIALVLWQGFEAATGHHRYDGKERIAKRVTSGAKALVYAALAFTMLKTALGESSSGSTSDSTTAKLMDAPAGQVLVAVVGLIILGVGIGQIVRGVTQRFKEDLAGGTGHAVEKLGVVGYVAKGIALSIVGALFGWAAISHDAKKGGGLDDALKTLLDQPYGAWLLSAVALGIGCFGVYCFAWAKDPHT